MKKRVRGKSADNEFRPGRHRGLPRISKRIRELLDQPGIRFLQHAAGAIQRILPHVETSRWTEKKRYGEPKCTWTSARTEIRLVIVLGSAEPSRSLSLTTIVRRRRLPAPYGHARLGLDLREHAICGQIALRASEVLRWPQLDGEGRRVPHACRDDASIRPLEESFDRNVVAHHVESHHALGTSVSSIFREFLRLSEQSHEGKSLAFACILDPGVYGDNASAQFPEDFLGQKKYKALSDGYHTAFRVSRDGKLVDLVDLEQFAEKDLSAHHFYPHWAESIAKASRDRRCGIVLSHKGDLLVFDEGAIKFSYRNGRWQYWNHAHLIRLLRDRAAAQRVQPSVVRQVVRALYRAAIDVSFRRTGGLFVILHNRNSLRDLVRLGDAIGDRRRKSTDAEFDKVLKGKKIHSLARSIAVELASLDGAVVLDNAGEVRAYGAILNPKRAGRIHDAEGSRTKAAIGASHAGLALKVSADGDITVYFKGQHFMQV